jgi:hypothetical protein
LENRLTKRLFYIFIQPKEFSMKNTISLSGIIAAVLFLALPFSAWAGGNKEKPAAPATAPAASTDKPAPAAPKPYTGNGGNGISITILPPRGAGLATEQNYLPDLVANELVSNFRSFSAMTLFDRVNNQKQYDELLSGIYADDDKAGLDLGHLSSTEYMLLGDITKTTTGYTLHLMVNKNSDKTTAAAYSGTCTVAELDNLTGVRRASLELLGKMDVQLTDKAKQELSGAARENTVNAQTALAQGIVAQRNGNIIESLAKFYEASGYDTSFAENMARANTLSSNIRSGGNFSADLQNIRNDIAWREEWRKLISEFRTWRDTLPNPIYAELVYNPEMSYTVDYESDIITFTYWAKIVKTIPNIDEYPPKKIADDLKAGLEATGRNKDWKLYAPSVYWRDVPSFYLYTADLLNDKGEKLSSHSFALDYWSDGERVGKIVGLSKIDGKIDTSYSLSESYVLSANFVVWIKDATETMSIKITNIYAVNQDSKYNSINKIIKEGPDIIPVRTTSEPISGESKIKSIVTFGRRATINRNAGYWRRDDKNYPGANLGSYIRPKD